MSAKTVKAIIAPVVVAVVVLGVWQLGWIHSLFGLRTFTVPLPFDIIAQMFTNAGRLGQAARESLIPGFEGFALGEAVGFVIASVIMAFPRSVSRQITVIVAAVQSLPSIGLIAIVSLWVNPADLIKVTVVAIMVAPSMVIYTYRGYVSANPMALELMDSLNASQWRVLWSVRLPTAVPHIFTQIKYAAVIMLVGVILTEIMKAGDGFGWIINDALNKLQAALGWAAVVAVASVGVVIYALAALLERLLFPWSSRHKP